MMMTRRCFGQFWFLSLLLLADITFLTTTTAADDSDAAAAAATDGITTTKEIVPGLQIFPTNVTCCPTIPLIGPAWMVDPTSLTLENINYQCSFVPDSGGVARPMVFVFQPNGIINGFSDENACHYFHGTYQIGAEPSSSYTYQFKWNRWKSQPYSCLPINCGTNNNNNDIDIFWSQISSSVTTLAITGYTNIELRDSIGRAIVRLEAILDSYTCRYVDNNSNNHLQSSYCHSVLNIPNLDKLGDYGLLSSTVMDYPPDVLALGGGGIPAREWDITASNHWRGVYEGAGGNAALGGERSHNRNNSHDSNNNNNNNNLTVTSHGNCLIKSYPQVLVLAMVILLSFA